MSSLSTIKSRIATLAATAFMFDGMICVTGMQIGPADADDHSALAEAARSKCLRFFEREFGLLRTSPQFRPKLLLTFEREFPEALEDTRTQLKDREPSDTTDSVDLGELSQLLYLLRNRDDLPDDFFDGLEDKNKSY